MPSFRADILGNCVIVTHRLSLVMVVIAMMVTVVVAGTRPVAAMLNNHKLEGNAVVVTISDHWQ